MKTYYYDEYTGNPYIGTDRVEGVTFMLPMNIQQGFSYRYEDVSTSCVKVEVKENSVNIFNTCTRR